MKIEQFQVQRADLEATRQVAIDGDAVGGSDVSVRIDRFALTANNITYGVVGERIGYWKFFPAEEPWGIIPVWGVGTVVQSENDGVAVGERLYGFFPTASHLRMSAASIHDQRFKDDSEHRRALPAVYNSYARIDRESWFDDSLVDERMLLFPLYATSFCIADFLDDNDFFGAEQVITLSASSKTAIGLQYALEDMGGGRRRVGLTSSRNLTAVETLSLYDDVLAYDQFDRIASKPSVIVDMSGNGAVLSDLHVHLGDAMRYTSNVGLTHFTANEMGPGFIKERSAMFFAPGHIAKRAEDWGPGEFEKRAATFWGGAALRSREWLDVRMSSGFDGLASAYAEVLDGRLPPSSGMVVSFDT